METAPVSKPLPDLAAAPGKPPYPIPTEILRGMVLTLARPSADAPETAWQEVVQAGLDKLEHVHPDWNPSHAFLAVPTRPPSMIHGSPVTYHRRLA